MSLQPDVLVTEQDRETARLDVQRSSRGSTAGGIALVALTNLLAVIVADAVAPAASGFGRALVVAGIAMVFAAPLLWGVSRLAKNQAIREGAKSAAHERQMATDARRREFETQLANALEMAEGEPEAHDAIQRAFASVVPESPVELLLADNSHAHLDRVVVSAVAAGDAPGCPVDSPEHCPAARRAQTQRFADSDALDACPKLRGREQGRCSAVCVPMSIMGRTVGVIHTTGVHGVPLDDVRIDDLETLANQAGARLGMLRVMAETQLQASTDGLTGLINRRTLENAARNLRASQRSFALVMADLDRFKELNDTHGHEAGDRALRIFAQTVRETLRTGDVACRFGGEEFTLVLPELATDDAAELMEQVRVNLATAVGRGDAPRFTASFGVVHSTDADTFDELVSIADRALFAAKHAGRDRVAVHDGDRNFEIRDDPGEDEELDDDAVPGVQSEVVATAEAGARLVTTSARRTA
jgi:diguanylate cyclase (GGDEF)-like protein